MQVIDIRAELKRSDTIQQTLRKNTRYVTIHYNGPSVKKYVTDLALFKADARFHVDDPPKGRGWDGIAYHFGVGRDGSLYQLRDSNARLPHCGVALGNNESYAVLVALGEGDIPTEKQLSGLAAMLEYLKVAPRFVLGHREWPRATACPGAQLRRWIDNYREINSGRVFNGRTKWAGNIRDEPDVTSHLVRTIPANTEITGVQILGKPVKGDSLWIKINGTSDFVHASLFGV